MTIQYGKRLTLQNIADMVGVSKTIVSKVVNHVPKVQVSAEKRAKIEEIVRRYNYSPLSSAQSLATRKTRQIAFLLSSHTTLGLSNSYYGTILAGVHDGCRERDYQCLVNVHDFTGNNEFMLPENLKKLSIDGCILTGYFNRLALEKLSILEIPMVLLCWELGSLPIPIISRDTRRDYSNHLDYFASRGHRHIWIGKDLESDQRLFAELSALRPEFRLELLPRENSRDEFIYGQEQAKRFLERPKTERPTLIFGSDHFCVAFLGVLASAGLHCPDDISIVTDSDTALAQWSIPPLTTVSQDRYQLGKDGVTLLVDILNGKLSLETARQYASQHPIPSVLIERKSVRNLYMKE